MTPEINNVHVTAEFLRGVRAAASYAHTQHEAPHMSDIIDATIAIAVREEAGP